MDKKSIKAVLSNSHFTERFIEYVEINFPHGYKKQFHQPYHGNYLDNPLLSLNPHERIIETLAQLDDLKGFYEDKEIPLHHFYKSIYDLSFRVERFYDEQEFYGLSDRDLLWLSSLYQAKIFDLGSLRYEISHFSYKEIERSGYQYMSLSKHWKKRLPEGTPIITLHILKDTDFRPNKIDESFQLAKVFLKTYFPEHVYTVFVCRTWLLYGATRDILGEDSNIASFSKRFEIIAKNQNIKQALDRIYGTDNLETIKNKPKTSSLEKLAYKNLDKLGVAAGIIYK